MYASSTVILGALMALAHVVVATPPACLLAALQVQTNPSDIKSLCGSLQNSMTGNITEKCTGSALTEAEQAYAATCLSSASVTVTFPSSSSSSSAASATKSGSSSATTTGSSHVTPTAGSGSGSASVSASKTGSVNPTGTGAAASSTSSAKSNSAGSSSPNFFMASAPIILAAGFTIPYLL